MKIFVPKVDESIKALYVSMDESKKRTAMLRALRELLEKAFSSDYSCESEEDLKMICFHLLIHCLVKIRLMKKGVEMSQL